jgi:hypothetical protein
MTVLLFPAAIVEAGRLSRNREAERQARIRERSHALDAVIDVCELRHLKEIRQATEDVAAQATAALWSAMALLAAEGWSGPEVGHPAQAEVGALRPLAELEGKAAKVYGGARITEVMDAAWATQEALWDLANPGRRLIADAGEEDALSHNAT